MAYATQQPVIGMDYGTNAVPKGELYALRRWKPRQDVGTVAAFMPPVSAFMLRNAGPRRNATYRAFRRAFAKDRRRDARRTAGHLVLL